MLFSLLIAATVLMASANDAKPPDRARANLGSYFSTDDYPAMAVRRGSEGTVRFELEIGTDGRVSKCNITGSSGDTDLDATTCAILSSRATYSPARDAEGRAIVGSDRGSVTWRLPDDPGDDGSHHPPFAAMQLASTMRRAADGTVTCTFAYNGQQTRLGTTDQCAFFQDFGAQQALRDLAGEAQLTLIFTVTPVGGPPVSGVTPEGEVVFDTTAEIEVGADGGVAACRMAELRAPRPLPGLRGIPDLCGTYRVGGRPAFQPNRHEDGVRRGRLRNSLYFRVGSASSLP